MKKRDRTLALLLMLAMALALLSGCGSMAQAPAAEAPMEAPSAEPAADAADLVLTNGTIQTMVSEDDTAEAVAVKNGEIVYVGTPKESRTSSAREPMSLTLPESTSPPALLTATFTPPARI